MDMVFPFVEALRQSFIRRRDLMPVADPRRSLPKISGILQTSESSTRITRPNHTHVATPLADGLRKKSHRLGSSV